MRKTTARVAVALRLDSVLFSAPMALRAAIPPLSISILITAIIALTGWTALSTKIALSQGLAR